MADSTNDIRQYNRIAWTLGDIREIVNDLSDWDDGSAVRLTAPEPQSERGTIEVVGQE